MKRWQAHHGKAEDVLGELEANVALLLTDPPYGNAHQSGWRPDWGHYQGNEPAEREEVYAVLSRAARLLAAANQHIYVFGEWDLTRVTTVFKSAELVWDKAMPVTGDLDLPWSRNWEPIQFALGRSARTKGESLMRKRRGSVLRHPAITGQRAHRHPHEKPVPLLRELIEVSTRPGDVVLDTYMGSGSTGVAALLEGRRFVGIEREADFHALACGRLERAEAAWLSQEGI